MIDNVCGSKEKAFEVVLGLMRNQLGEDTRAFILNSADMMRRRANWYAKT